MANASKDSNNVPTLLGRLNSDGSTPINIRVGPTTHILHTSDGTSGSSLGNATADRDGNYETTLIGVSSADGTTPVAVYANSSGQLLIKST